MTMKPFFQIHDFNETNIIESPITLVSTPTKANRYIDPSIAAKKYVHLCTQNPANGGTPAIDNNVIVKVIANSGLIRER